MRLACCPRHEAKHKETSKRAMRWKLLNETNRRSQGPIATTSLSPTRRERITVIFGSQAIVSPSFYSPMLLVNYIFSFAVATLFCTCLTRDATVCTRMFRTNY